MKHYLLIIAFGFLFACTETTKEEQTESKKDSTLVTPTQKDSIYESLQNNVNASWEKLTQNELQRIEDLNRLLLEVSYIPSVNDAELKKAQELTVELNQYIYNQSEIPDFDIVAKNDERIEELVGLVFNFADISLTSSDKEYPFINELKTDIKESIQRIADLSSEYSESVQSRNDYLHKNLKQLEGMGYQDLKPLKSFFDTPTL